MLDIWYGGDNITLSDDASVVIQEGQDGESNRIDGHAGRDGHGHVADVRALESGCTIVRISSGKRVTLMVTSKTFDTSTVQGMKSAERFKSTLNNKYVRVTVQTVGLDRVRITGAVLIGGNAIGRTRQAKMRIRCNQCEALMINGVFCHETGCPNTRSRYDAESGEWIKQRKCFECGCTVDADDECCNVGVSQ